MSKSVNSPTARLLQSSRLFSLPRALPRQDLERVAGFGQFRHSDTATQPYPTLQAITTPTSSLFRGDWGLKRGIPARAARSTNTPHIRIQANDTRYQITDYDSAADHTQTRSKWEEMGVPLIRPEEKRGRSSDPAPVSAYEDEADFTDPAREDGVRRRWKNEGPWVVGMAEGEFDDYVARTVTGRRAAWREFLRTALLEEKVREARIQAQSQGQVFDETHEKSIRTEQALSDKDLDAKQKELRDDHAASGNASRLTELMSRFLDLPKIEQQFDATKLSSWLQTVGAESEPPYTTHPAAGLSYLRTSAIMENHPIHGPQEQRSPVLSRVLRFKSGIAGKLPTARLGVGGVLMNDPVRSTMHRERGGSEAQKNAADAVNTFDHGSDTGAKIWVRVENATVTDRGTIKGRVHRASDEAIAVKTGNVEDIHRQRAASFVSVNSSPSSSLPAFRTFSPRGPSRVRNAQAEGQRPSTASGEIQDLLQGGRK